VHARLRVQRAPGIPHALLGGADFMHDSGASCRGVVNVCPELGPVMCEERSDEAIPTQSFRGDAKHRTRNLEIPGLVLRTIPE
jgi:hypothetical protein